MTIYCALQEVKQSWELEIACTQAMHLRDCVISSPFLPKRNTYSPPLFESLIGHFFEKKKDTHCVDLWENPRSDKHVWLTTLCGRWGVRFTAAARCRSFSQWRLFIKMATDCTWLYLRWGTLADPRLGRADANQCKSSDFLQELLISGFPRFSVSPTSFRAK